MPMPMTTRRWMAAVAVIAMLLAGGLSWKRRAAFLVQADLHERSAAFWDVRRQRYDRDGGFPIFNEKFFESDDTVKPYYGSRFRRRAEHHASLGRKYRHAAAHPWLAVEPDPPEP